MKQKMSAFPYNIAVMIIIAVLAMSGGIAASRGRSIKSCAYMKPRSPPRAYKVYVTDFGAVGDGVTLNTQAIQNAIQHIAGAAGKGGAMLYFPPGRWLTGSFGLVSHVTLSFHKDAVLLGSMNSEDWPVIDPLPSYGRGRELPGRRHQSLIYGYNVKDVIITGDNATINGQGNVWWDWFHNKTLDYTRPHLIDKVVVKNLTIIAPYKSPNTDGVDPDSSNDVCIEDCYISNGDDHVAIKSGWDQYGISFGRPSTNIHIYRLTGESQSSGVVIGSEMSGGVSEVYVEGLKIYNSPTAITIRLTPGRGGYVRNVYISDVVVRNVTTAIYFNNQFGEHPGGHFNPKALPLVEKITIKDVVGDGIRVAGLLQGFQGDDFRDICLYNVTLNATSVSPWNCSYVHGYSGLVSPSVCEPLKGTILPKHYSDCYDFIGNGLIQTEQNKMYSIKYSTPRT
ncbi:putative polygalacturonase [Bienertia sinuspersici]